MNTATELSRPGLSPTVPMPRIRATPAGFGRGRGDQQRRRQLVQLADVAGARILQRLGGDRGDRERHVRQASLRRVAVTTMSLVSLRAGFGRLIVDRGGFGGGASGRLG